MFKVFRGEDGRRDICQISTGEKAPPGKSGPRSFSDLGKALEPKGEAEMREVEVVSVEEEWAVMEAALNGEAEAPSSYTELAQDLYTKAIKHLLPLVNGLKTEEEVRLIHDMELLHPKYEGGRGGVLNALEERRGELELPNAKIGVARAPARPQPEAVAEFSEQEEETSCPHCDFVAGSGFGLQTHVAAIHLPG